MDWSDKVEAYNIDETCAGYNNQSTEVQFHPHSTKFEERWAPSPAPHKHPVPTPLSSLPPSSRLASGSWGSSRPLPLPPPPRPSP